MTSVLVDDEDRWLLKLGVWTVDKYVHAYVDGKTIYLHKLICPGHHDVDHINGNTLDNRRSNLRPCTPSQNGANRGKQSNNTSGWKGVYRRPDRAGGKVWYARLCKPSRHLGYFNCPTRAAIAYDKGAMKRWGGFARTNILENI